MDFTRETFLNFCKSKVPYGTTLDLEMLDCFGYFECEPYAGVTIRYNVEKIENTEYGIVLTCSTRVRNFCTGMDKVDEHKFMRYAKEIRLLGNYPEWLISQE